MARSASAAWRRDAIASRSRTPASSRFNARSRCEAGEPRRARDCVELHGARLRSGARSLAIEFPDWIRYQNQDGEYPFVRNRGFDPYDQNVLKGDLPIVGDDIFMVLTAISETPFEYRAVPTPSGVSAERPRIRFFGNGSNSRFCRARSSRSSCSRATPRSSRATGPFRITPQFNLNYVQLARAQRLNATPEAAARGAQHLALQEAFAEVKIAEVGPNYDFISVRGGIQPFNSRFPRLSVPRQQSRRAGVRQLGPEPQPVERRLLRSAREGHQQRAERLQRREQRVFIANYYRQDFLTEGYTSRPAFTPTWMMATSSSSTQRLPRRPSPIGLIQPHQVHAYYAGFGGDGHWGRSNVTHQFYQAFGSDEFNGIAAPAGGHQRAVCRGRILDRPGLVPSAHRRRLRLWRRRSRRRSRDGVRRDHGQPEHRRRRLQLLGAAGAAAAADGVGLDGRNSVLPALRSSKNEGQANFVNPGVLVINGGVDAELTTKLKLITNVNLLRFHHTEIAATAAVPGRDRQCHRRRRGRRVPVPAALNDNMVITGGLSALVPAAGSSRSSPTRCLYAPFLVVTLTY